MRALLGLGRMCGLRKIKLGGIGLQVMMRRVREKKKKVLR